MTANAKTTKRHKEPGTMLGIRPGESLDECEQRVGDDVPEWTEEDFARAIPIADFPELAEALERARGQRGPQKAPTKQRVGLRLDADVVAHFRATGPGWQRRINEVLADYIRRDGK